MNKKALSATVNVVLLIAITIVAGGIIWGVINNLVTTKLDDSASCYGLYEKIQLNDEYTCYNATDQTLRFSINLIDIIPDSVLIAAQNDENSTSIILFSNETTIPNLVSYPDDETGKVSLPKKESGKSYTLSGVDTLPTKVLLAPTMNGKACDVLDTITPVVFCN